MILRRADIRKSPLALVVECRVLTVALFSQERGQQVSLVIAIPGTVVMKVCICPSEAPACLEFPACFELGRLKRRQSEAVKLSKVF